MNGLTSFARLPSELTYYICHKLDPVSLNQFSATCTKIHENCEVTTEIANNKLNNSRLADVLIQSHVISKLRIVTPLSEESIRRNCDLMQGMRFNGIPGPTAEVRIAEEKQKVASGYYEQKNAETKSRALEIVAELQAFQSELAEQFQLPAPGDNEIQAVYDISEINRRKEVLVEKLKDQLSSDKGRIKRAMLEQEVVLAIFRHHPNSARSQLALTEFTNNIREYKDSLKEEYMWGLDRYSDSHKEECAAALFSSNTNEAKRLVMERQVNELNEREAWMVETGGHRFATDGTKRKEFNKKIWADFFPDDDAPAPPVKIEPVVATEPKMVADKHPLDALTDMANASSSAAAHAAYELGMLYLGAAMEWDVDLSSIRFSHAIVETIKLNHRGDGGVYRSDDGGGSMPISVYLTQKGKGYLEKAASQGNRQAQDQLDKMKSLDQGDIFPSVQNDVPVVTTATPTTTTTTKATVIKAPPQDNPEVEKLLQTGLLYANGSKEVRQDDSKAKENFKLAYQAGTVANATDQDKMFAGEAACKLGQLLDQSLFRAFRFGDESSGYWYKKAALLGHEIARKICDIKGIKRQS